MQMFHAPSSSRFEARLASGPEDIAAAQRLRYDVFVTEGGAQGGMVDHTALREADRWDAFADHLLLCDLAAPAGRHVVGTYRMMTAVQARAAGGFYSAQEFNLAGVLGTGRRVLELGRSCLHPAYRGSAALQYLWAGLADYVAEHGIEVLFGVASFPGTDPATHAQALGLLATEYHAPDQLALTARGDGALPMDLHPQTDVNRRVAMREMPGLIKSYLRLGARVGTGAYVDQAFNTIDVCMVLDADRIPAKRLAVLEAAV